MVGNWQDNFYRPKWGQLGEAELTLPPLFNLRNVFSISIHTDDKLSVVGDIIAV